MACAEKKSVVGVLSDTHGPLNSWTIKALAGVDHIIHAGDIVSEEVIPYLKRIAPVTSVRGNMDGYGVSSNTSVAQCQGALFYVLHDLESLDLNPKSAGFHAVIHGHTHRAEIQWIDSVLYLNPGSANRPRGAKKESIALIEIEKLILTPKIVFKAC